MFVALDKEGYRVYADEVTAHRECFCPVCNGPLISKPGKGGRRPHFAHQPDSECSYSLDKDNKSEWHRRMQEYFPREAQEYRFKDEETGEVHIADVYIEQELTVLEFQHSPIDKEEFISRTAFHLKHGRRVVWLFDESTTGKGLGLGRLKKDDLSWETSPYAENSFKWSRNPRYVLNCGPDLFQCFSSYCVCVYTGAEGDVFHRIVNQHDHFQYVTLSLEDIKMENGISTDVFFRLDLYWLSRDPWRNQILQKLYEYQILQRPKVNYSFRPYYPRKRHRRF